MTRLIDTHCHVYMDEFAEDARETLDRARDVGVSRAMVIGCDELSSFAAVRFAKDNSSAGSELRASIGVHPHEADGIGATISDELEDLAENEHVRAVGEIGLDYFYDNSPRRKQIEVFEMQVFFARRVKLPIIVHIRNAQARSDGDAYRESMALLKRCHADECGGIIHCFSGDRDDARAALDLGFHISFAGPITYPKAEELREAARYSPIDRILCETDSPYLAPQKKRGKRNEPANVLSVYEKIAEIKERSLEEFAEIVWQNAEDLLKF